MRELLDPRSVAVVGASDNPSKVGGRPLAYLLRHGYAGRILPVNPKHDEVMGLACARSIGELSEVPDLAMVSLPARMVPDALTELGKLGVSQAIVFSSGFSEAGAEGRALEAQLAEAAAAAGIRVTGPNSIGVISTPAKLTATFMTALERDGDLLPGNAALVSQSGALAAFLHAQAAELGLGFSRLISVGNEADHTVADFLHHLATDEETDLVCGYLEGVADGAALLDAVDHVVGAGKTLALLKVGRSDRGARAAASHTGSLAGSDRVYDAALRQRGVLRVDDLRQLLDLMRLRARPDGRASRPVRPPVAILTISGGAGVWAVDRLADLGVEISDLGPETTRRLVEILPPYGSARNPVDITGNIVNQPELFGAALETVLADEHVGTVVILLGLQEHDGERIAGVIADAAARTDKTIAVSWMAGPGVAYTRLADAGVPAFADLRQCAEAVANAIAAGRLADARTAPVGLADAAPLELPEAPTEHEAKRHLEAIGIPVMPGRLVMGGDEAAEAAAELGAPVVLKGQAGSVRHKTEAGFVRVGVDGTAAVREAYAAIEAAGAGIDDWAGVLVERFAPEGVDTIIGIVRDPVFGPVVMFGLGGVLVELLGDVAFRVAPVDRAQAAAMIDETRGARLLDGYRAAPPADRAALVDAIVAISGFAAAHAADVEELEVNPLRVLPAGQGVVALDALLVPRSGVAHAT